MRNINDFIRTSAIAHYSSTFPFSMTTTLPPYRSPSSPYPPKPRDTLVQLRCAGFGFAPSKGLLGRPAVKASLRVGCALVQLSASLHRLILGIAFRKGLLGELAVKPSFGVRCTWRASPQLIRDTSFCRNKVTKMYFSLESLSLNTLSSIFCIHTSSKSLAVRHRFSVAKLVSTMFRGTP